MKIKIKNKIYNSNNEPIMIIFDSKEERDGVTSHLFQMDNQLKYCVYPDKPEYTKNNYQKIKEFMKL